MAALTCEICGGKLMGRPGGIFECDSCGMEYDTAWAKAKIQEIKGTVKVEGTVEVTGTVKLDGPVKVEGGVNADNLLMRGQLALKNKRWVEASKHFDDALNFNVECVEAYLGKCCADYRYADIHAVIKNNGAKLLASDSFKNAIYFMDASMAQQFQEEIDAAENCFAALKKQEEERAIAEAKEQRRIEAEQKAKEEARVANKRKQLEAARVTAAELKGLLSASSGHCACVNQNGTVYATGRTKNKDGELNVGGWKDVLSVVAGDNFTVGIKTDGTVLYTGDYRFAEAVRNWNNMKSVTTFHSNARPVIIGLDGSGNVIATQEYVSFYRNGRTSQEKCIDTQTAVRAWRNIESIACGSRHLIGLKSDGTVVATGDNSNGQCSLQDWEDVVAIAGGSSHSVGLKSDGTVIACGYGANRELDVDGWHDIVDIAAYVAVTFGLQANGTVVMTGDPRICIQFSDAKYWKDIVSIVCEGSGCLYGLKADGTIESAGHEEFPCDFSSDMQLFISAYDYAQKRQHSFSEMEHIAAERRAKDLTERKESLKGEQTALTAELSKLKGFFSGMRRREIESRLAEIETELKGL